MSTIIASHELLFTYAEVAQAAGLQEYSLRSGAVLPDHFGTPRHWKLNRHSTPCLTETGLRELAESLRANGNPVAARSLEVLREQRTGTPARALALPPIEKNSAIPLRSAARPGFVPASSADAENPGKRFSWQDRKDCGGD